MKRKLKNYSQRFIRISDYIYRRSEKYKLKRLNLKSNYDKKHICLSSHNIKKIKKIKLEQKIN